MNINIIGGGPAGLYFALLMKRHTPAHVVNIFERNGENDTFGWGVVFSDKTLSYLGEADESTYRAITENFTTWDNVDVVHRDARVTIRGNKFSGIARLKLLNILQERCRELDVHLHYDHEITNVADYEGCDLLIGADGVNSLVRRAYEEQFQPDVSVRPNKYIWFGTRQLFHGLTLTFRTSDAGTFCAHSYKFNSNTSTFIVECDAETWRRASFETMSDEATRRYLETVFAVDLDGHALLSNNSKWINFLLVRNRHWHHRHIALLGDALHTAHFSIGSGTKLALEDAIALFKSFAVGDDVPSALANFERMRRPVIEEYQRAAYESLLWFEHAGDYMHLEPLALAYKLMTRSTKVTHENLRRRDPAFIAAYEAALDATGSL